VIKLIKEKIRAISKFNDYIENIKTTVTKDFERDSKVIYEGNGQRRLN
jgi:phosphoheptose isomerase